MMTISEERKTGRIDGRRVHRPRQTDGDERDKVVCLLMGDLHGVTGERKRKALFSSLNENGRNVSLPPAPHGIIKEGDAKASLIRFFNY